MKSYSILFLFLFCHSGFAQDYSAMYRLELSDASTYSTSCGSTGNQEWVVSRNSCNLYTTMMKAGELPTFGNRTIDVSLKLSNSGNLDDKDFAWIFYYINEKPAGSKTLKGSENGDEIHFKDQVLVPARSSFHVRVALVCDEEDEYWKITNGDFFMGQRAAEGEDIVEDPKAVQKVYARKDRNIVRLHWNDRFTGEEAYYRVERSADGEKFQFAGFVKLNKSSSELVRHSFIDSAPFQPVSFYRVSRIQDQDQPENFGDVVKVRW